MPSHGSCAAVELQGCCRQDETINAAVTTCLSAGKPRQPFVQRINCHTQKPRSRNAVMRALYGPTALPYLSH